MRLKKKSVWDATFWTRFTILLCITQLLGCLPRPAIPEERFRRAEELVDVGTAFLRARDLVEAQKAYELAAELAPVAAAVDGQGCVALLEGRYDDAEGFFREALQMDRRYDEALANLGLLREVQGDREGAGSIYREYLENNPDSATIRNNLLALEYDEGRGTMRTIHELEKAIKLSDQPVIKKNLALLKEGKGL